MLDIISQMVVTADKFLPNDTAKLRKKTRNCFIELIILFVVMNKVNFTQLSLYGERNEKTYRSHFERGDLDMIAFNLELAKEFFADSTGVKALAIDPSYISHSGKRTPFMGYFWSGVAGKSKWGLEILGFGIVDALRNACIMLGARQTPDTKSISHPDVQPSTTPIKHFVGKEAISDYDDIKDGLSTKTTRPYHKASDAEAIKKLNEVETEEGFSLIDWYLHVIVNLSQAVKEYTSLVVADAFFSKYKFAKGLLDAGYHLVSRLRDDAALWYIYNGPQTGKKGRPKMYDGKVDLNNLDMSVFQEVDCNVEKGTCYAGIVYSKSLKMKIKVVIWFSEDKKIHKIYFSNRLSLVAVNILKVYRTRFQCEFEFRNAKGYASLNKCQARSTKKLDTHFNMSFTSMNVLKFAAKQMGITFSVSNLKSLAQGQYLLERFIEVSGISPDEHLIEKLHQEIISLTTLEIDCAA